MKKIIFYSACCFFIFLNSNAQSGSSLDSCAYNDASSDIRAMYVSKADDVINENTTTTFGLITGDELLEWADDNNFNYLILYGITSELNTNETAFTPKLGAFVKKAHQDYSIKVSVNVASYNSATIMADYQDAAIATDSLMELDALHYEAEYWRSGSGIVFDDGTSSDYESQLGLIYTLCQSYGIDCETYIGNPTHGAGSSTWSPTLSDPDNIQGQYEIDYINNHTDRIFVAYYKSNPFSPSGNIFQSKKYRFAFLQNSAYASDIVVLFSCNSTSSDPNMYSWLDGLSDAFTDRLPLPYNIWMNCSDGYHDHPSGTAGTNNVNVEGYCWYRFHNLYEMSDAAVATGTLSEEPVLENQSEVYVYPNPSNKILHISQTTKGNFTASVIDVTGKVIIQQNDVSKINISGLENGVYFLQINYAGGKCINKRFVKE